ncbi:MAG: hypothetical protein KIS96_01635 [Bauldia sp.]|nr:hypothetical protein [Bauldia sp.]
MFETTPGRAAAGLMSGALLFLVAAPASAADPIAIADDLVALMTSGTRTAAYESAVETEPGIVTITNFSITDEPNGAFGEVATIVVTNPVESDEGGFSADSVLLIGGSLTDEVNVIEWEEAELTAVAVPAALDEIAVEDAPLPAAGLTVRGVAFVPPQANPLLIESVTLTLGEAVDGVPYAVAVSLGGIEVPTGVLDNSEPVAILRSMGFDTLYLDVSVGGSFDSEDDVLTLDDVAIGIRDFGRIELAGILTGVPLSRLAEPGGVEILLGTAKVVELQARFENAGAVEGFLAEQARQTDMAAEDVAFGLSTAFRIFLRTFNSPQLEDQVGDAVGAFLLDPRSISLVARPMEPVPLLEAVGLMMSDPTLLPTLLGVTVSAND